MLVILQMSGMTECQTHDIYRLPQLAAPEINNWLFAADVHEARRQAERLGDMRLAQWLYSMEFPSPGRYELPAGFGHEARYVMLVS